MQDELRRAIEDIKLRAPIEDVVRERVPELRKRGSLWEACCPFHQERTPSFKVDPRRGTWHCFGACSEGGDSISFVEHFDRVAFWDALEILAARTGVELPRRGPGRADDGERDRALECLARAAAFFVERLGSAEGEAARRYLDERGLEPATVREFGLGWSPAAGTALLEHARRAEVPLELLEKTGLARVNDRGRPYDFFRGRLMIPIRDLRGRVVGFGGRRLADASGGPKYVNTPETELFKKGGIVYGLDRALKNVRRSGELVLVEGYTDVIAAHQVGLTNVGAVLGTATTEEHAGLVRRAGARRVSLVFDGDEAGGKAAHRALAGLLPLEVELAVVALPAGIDPCDLMVRDGAGAFSAHLEQARPWFEHLLDGLRGLRAAELSRAVDEVLELLARVPKPVHRESLFRELAARLQLAPETLRAQWQAGPGRRRRRGPETVADGPRGRSGARPESPDPGVAPGLREAYTGLVAAVLADDGLVPLVRSHVSSCPDPDLARILSVIVRLYDEDCDRIDAGVVTTCLESEGHPARHRVEALVQHSRTCAESPKSLLEAQLAFLRRREDEARLAELRERIEELERDPRPEAAGELRELSRHATELMRRAVASRGAADPGVPTVQSN